ncbi:MAG: amidase [Chloroflexota bacterium]
MADNELVYKPAAALAALIEKKQVSPIQVMRALLERIERLEPILNCYVSVAADAALAAAAAAEREIVAGGYRGPLHGIPVALKDIFDVVGMKTTASSKIMADYAPGADSTFARLLREAGAIIVGKTNLHEFAFGVTTNNPHFGPTRNPWDTTRVPGGSSGGSGAAVAASLCTMASGSDTGGSIRIPAFLCGIVGLKPTFGRVSKRGVVPLAWSLDHTGPMTKSVEDAALMMDAVAGYDPADPSSANAPVPSFSAAIGRDIAGRRLGVPRGFFFDNLDPQVKRALDEAIAAFGRLGVSVQEVDLPHIEYSPSAFPAIIHSEAAAFHEPWLLSRPQDYGADVRSRLEVGRTVLATQYVNAQRARTLICRDFATALAGVDALITPTMPTTAVPIGDDEVEIGGQKYEVRAAYNRLTSPINLTGLPAIAVPCGFSEKGLPMGFQLIGRAFEEPGLLSLAHAYEVGTEWHLRRPPLD